ncbi:B-cell differentiation antigen CD72-like [Anolis sagrei]|uniref:B-cell differentiation antigen CD72-like n=1 Tax=Anolis sagrei TaxID=38937 RepID=UPI00351FA334
MSQGNDVTYADLNFGKTPPKKALHSEPNEGDLAYENVYGPGAKEVEEEEEEEEEEEAPGRGKAATGWKGWTRKIALGAVATSLFLLATTVGLGVRYWQVSGQLHRASQSHTAHSAALAQRIGAQEEILDETEGQLQQVREELSSTREALRKSQEAANKTQQHLQGVEEVLREANHNLETLKQENKEKEALLRQRIGSCPPGWKLFRWKCFWISDEMNYWRKSLEDCQKKHSQLAILKKPWDIREFWDAVILKNSLQNSEYWIGLSRTWSTEKNTWASLWADGSAYEVAESWKQYYYGKISSGNLGEGYWQNQHQYICEVAASSSVGQAEIPWHNN